MNHTRPSFTITVNFLSDICQKIDIAFKHFNIDIPQALSEKEKVECYIDWQCKMISPKKRHFNTSTQILQDVDNKKIIGAIKNDSIKGAPLFKYQSRQIKNIFDKKENFKHDALLNDWNIHHFHLGKNIENDGFVTRTNDHLYAVVTDSDIFAICICSHGEYSNPKALTIIKDNWPHLFKKMYCPSTYDSNMEFDNNFIKRMRKKRALFSLNIEGSTIFSGHTTASGANIGSVLKSDFILYKIKQQEQAFTPEIVLKYIPTNVSQIAILNVDINISSEITIDNLITKILNNEDIPLTLKYLS